MTDLDDKQEYKMPVPIEIPPGPPCPGCKKPVTTFGEMRARCMSCGLDFVDAFLRPEAKSDLEEFKAFFGMKGIPFTQYEAPDDNPDKEMDGLAICDAILKFNDDGEFIGVFNYESGYYHERIPAPEGG